MRADTEPMTWMDADAPALGGEERSDETPGAETGQARRAPDPEVVAKPTRRIEAHPLELLGEQRSEPFRVRLPDVVLVQPAELVVVERGGGPVHVGDVEPRDHLRAREDLLVAVRPAEPHELVEQRLRQVPVVAKLHHPHRTMALREPLAVRAEDHRHVGVARRRRIQRRDEVQLPGGWSSPRMT